MLSQFKPTIDKKVQSLVTPLANVDPNTLTIIGIVPSILFFIAILKHQLVWAMIFYLGNVFDLIDGAVAKKFHKITAFGGFLDSTLDRISDFLIISSLGFAHIVSWEIVICLLFVSYLVSYARSRAELAAKGNINVAVGLIERTERLILIFAGLLLYWAFPGVQINRFNILELTFLLLTAFSAITFLQRVMFAYKKLAN